MENDEKRKKVIDELERRKEIVEDYLDSIDDSSKDSDPYGYVIHKTRYQLIDAALDFVRDNFFEHNECDYSTYESYELDSEKEKCLLVNNIGEIINKAFSMFGYPESKKSRIESIVFRKNVVNTEYALITFRREKQ